MTKALSPAAATKEPRLELAWLFVKKTPLKLKAYWVAARSVNGLVWPVVPRLLMIPTLCSGVNDNQLFVVGGLTELLVKMSHAPDPFGVPTRKSLLPSLFMSTAATLEPACCDATLPVSRTPRPGSVVMVPPLL